MWLCSALSAWLNLHIFDDDFFFFFRAFREFGFFYKSTFLMYSTGKSCGVLLVKDGNFKLTQCRLTLVVVNLGFLGSFVAFVTF